MSIACPSPLTAGLGLALPLVFIALLAFAPGSADARLAAMLSGICAQRPSHTLGVPGEVMAIEARMFGIFAGFAVAVAVAWLRGGWRHTRLPRGWQLLTLLAFVLVMAVDGTNALLSDTTGRSPYGPRNDLRLVTGLLGGLALAAFAAPAVSEALWKKTEDTPLFPTGKDLGITMAALAGVAAVSLSGVLPTIVLSVAAVLAVVASFWLVNVHFCVLAWEGSAGATAWQDLNRYAVVGFALAVTELVGLAALRAWMQAAYGIYWVV